MPRSPCPCDPPCGCGDIYYLPLGVWTDRAKPQQGWVIPAGHFEVVARTPFSFVPVCPGGCQQVLASALDPRPDAVVQTSGGLVAAGKITDAAPSPPPTPPVNRLSHFDYGPFSRKQLRAFEASAVRELMARAASQMSIREPGRTGANAWRVELWLRQMGALAAMLDAPDPVPESAWHIAHRFFLQHSNLKAPGFKWTWPKGAQPMGEKRCGGIPRGIAYVAAALLVALERHGIQRPGGFERLASSLDLAAPELAFAVAKMQVVHH